MSQPDSQKQEVHLRQASEFIISSNLCSPAHPQHKTQFLGEFHWIEVFGCLNSFRGGVHRTNQAENIHLRSSQQITNKTTWFYVQI